MLEEKLIVGRFIHFTNPLAPAVGPRGETTQFYRVPQNVMHIDESTGIFTKTSNIAANAHATKPWRTFGWLPWIPGWISEVQMGGFDVLTGPMSGCVLAVYRRQDGNIYVGHIGTDIALSLDANTDVKRVWNIFATNVGNVNLLGGFNPSGGWQGAYPAPQDNDRGAPTIIGLCTTDVKFYTLVLYAQADPPGGNAVHPTLRRIAGLQEINKIPFFQLSRL